MNLTEDEILIRAREASNAAFGPYGPDVLANLRSGKLDLGCGIPVAIQALRDLTKPLSEIQSVDPDLVEARKLLIEHRLVRVFDAPARPRAGARTVNLNELADRVEAATADQTRTLLWEAFKALHSKPTGVAIGVHDRFVALLDAGAFLDAAMSLYLVVPERIPSDPRKATAEALRQIAAGAA